MPPKHSCEDRWSDDDPRFRTIFDGAAMGVAIVDPAGHIIETNAALNDMLGYTAEELRGVTFAKLTHPSDLDADLKLCDEILTNRRDGYELEKRYVRKDGSLVWAKLVASVIRDANGQPRYGIGMVADISQQKQLEQQFLHAQKMEAIGRFAGGVAHDFNNLLTVIRGYSEFILACSHHDDPHYADADEIRRAADRAALLTQQLLSFSRKREHHPQVIDVNRVVRDTRRMLSRLIGEDITLSLRLSEKPCSVLADPGQIEQVLMNLAVNARDAMPDGGSLMIETAEETVPEGPGALVCGGTGHHVRISVVDSGVGIPDEIQDHIFEPFFTTKEPGKGTGLGLSTVYAIVAQVGGTIRVRSVAGHGTRFDVLLPCVAQAAEIEAESAVSSVRAGTETILIVEDDKSVRRMAQRALEELGYTVFAAPSGHAAVVIASAYAGRIHAVVSDVVMPGISGPACVARLEETRPDIRVLYVSGYAHDTMAQHGLSDASAGFLRKPFTPDELARAVRQVLR